MFKREKKAGGYRDGGRILLIPVGDILPNPDQPRREFDQTALRELAQSIAENGLINPLAVSLRDGVPVLVAGERRLRALRMLGWSEAPCVAVNEEQGGQNAVRTLIENMQRVDMNCFEEAEGIGRLIREYGLTQEEASKSVGRSRPAITNAMRLLSLSKDVLPLVEDGTLSAGHARALLPISDPNEQLKAARAVIDGALSVRKTEQLVTKTLKKLAEEPAEDSKSSELMVDYIAETEDFLSRSLSRKVALEQKRKGGRIILEFYDSDDREALISNLARMGRSWEEIIK